MIAVSTKDQIYSRHLINIVLVNSHIIFNYQGSTNLIQQIKKS